MKNYTQKGDRLIHTALTNITGGDPVVIGTHLGVACGDIAAGASGAVAMEGVYSLPKATGVIDQGADCYFDVDGNPVGGTAGTGAITTTVSSNASAGYAFEAAASADTHIAVKLRG
jgi:predicted RecA/RadA family phage recombinase